MLLIHSTTECDTMGKYQAGIRRLGLIQLSGSLAFLTPATYLGLTLDDTEACPRN